jgi:predicted RNA-binding Zn-ribbon protein involved in translation (DUF1610 family)
MEDISLMVNEMVKMFAKCPKCGSEKEVRIRRGSESVEGDCDDCKIHFITTTWWAE